MKKIYTSLIIFALSIASVFSQVTDVVLLPGSNQPKRLFLVDNILYFSQATKISYIDITETDPVHTVLISNLNSPGGMEIKDNFLYIAHFGDGDVIKVDLDDPTPSIIDVTFFGNTPNMLKFNGNDLYFTDNNGNRIYKYDITSSSPTAETFVNTPNNSSPIGIDIKDGILYYSQANMGNILKLDLNNPNGTPIEVVSGLIRPIGIEFKGNDLYVADVDGDKIVKIDVTQSPTIAEDVVTNLNLPTDITFDGDIMYISQLNKISKIDLSLSVDEFSTNNIVLYPNPTKDYLTISNLQSDLNFDISDVNGRVLKKGVVSPNTNIDVSSLSHGYYFITFDGVSSITKKFIKN
ncbi:T9SS type A sorting domain-containing protein [Psychroserpens luteus]|uniref:T9SS type A sorting domain-containing protein n=1 Tax=Psychroserpens luteus TaxID=1434066 RepID=A0ABW5ZVK8_9FLAO|nr:T9SS type A sorting domain-containing protein [Psychroserpens luteus]